MATIHLAALRQIYNDGNHNAFTDLCHFQGRYYLTFRSCPEGHMLFTSSRILVLSSADGQDWSLMYTFSVPGRDVRDPHFLLFQDRLFVYTGTWLVYPGEPHRLNTNEHQGYCAWSTDGITWQGPQRCEGTHGYYIWRAATYGGVAYLNGRRTRNFMVVPDRKEDDALQESWLLQSNDGFTWQPHGLIQPAYGDETAFLFTAEGTALAVARTTWGKPAQFCQARPPYIEWTRQDLERPVGGPLLAQWGEHYLVGGRKTLNRAQPTTVLYWLIDGHLAEILELPSGGDTSYPGFVAASPTHGFLSYYSSHEGSGTSLAPSHIYLAELTLVEK